MPFKKVGDIKIYYEVHGDGEPLVMISGCGADLSAWANQIPALSMKYHVITFDNRGTGRSDKPDIPYTMQMMAADVAGLLDSIGIGAAHILDILWEAPSPRNSLSPIRRELSRSYCHALPRQAPPMQSC